MKRILSKEWFKDRENIFLLAIMIIKLLFMGLFSSDYQNNLFLPFLLDFVKTGGNVYDRFYREGILNAFPYPTGMLLIESLGAFIINVFHVTNTFMVNFIFKLPSFVIDIIGINIINRFFPEKHKYTTVLYYASPIVIYSVYMHGQLDIIPMIMLVISLYFLSSKEDIRYRYVWGGLFLIISLLCKLHIIAVIPIIFFYLQKRDGIKRAIFCIGTVVIGVFIGILPVWSEGFTRMVLFNNEQSVLSKVSFSFGAVEIYIPIIAVVFVYLLAFKINYMNITLFLNLCGVVLAVFLAFCPPMPGWYVWIVPFLTLFFASSNIEKYKNMYIYVGLNLLYILYFVFLHNRGVVDLYFMDKDCSFLKIDEPLIVSAVFTVMSGVLIYLIISMYKLGVASNNLYKRRDIPFTIGIAGDSAAGKSTMIDLIEKIVGKNNLLFIEGDGDHRWERGDSYWDGYTALNPKANYLYRQADDLKKLRHGNAVRRVDYDHNLGKFSVQKKMMARKYVILCGLHAMFLPQTRKNLDLKIYMDSDETLRRYWKIKRDTLQRGHTKETVLQSIEERIPDAQKYIYPQKKYADIIVRYYDDTLKDCMIDDHEVNKSIQLTVSISVDIEPLVYLLNMMGISVNYDYSEDFENQVVNVNYESIKGKDIRIDEIAEQIIPQLEEITKEKLDKPINAGDGVLVLFLLLMISNKMQGE